MIQRNLEISQSAAKRLKESNKITSALYEHLSENSLFSIISIPGQKPYNFEQRYYCKIINSCLEKIFNLVKSEINISTYSKKLKAGIVITGGGAMIPQLKDYVEQVTGLYTQIGYPVSKLSNLQDRSLCKTRYATGIGLAILASQRPSPPKVASKEESIEDTMPFEEPIIHPKSKAINWIERTKLKINSILIDENPVDFD